MVKGRISEGVSGFLKPDFRRDIRFFEAGSNGSVQEKRGRMMMYPDGA